MSEGKGFPISPPAVQSVAACRVLKELAAGDREQQNQAAWMLEKLFSNIAATFARGTPGEKLLKSLPQKEGIALATALTVVGTYFEFQGDWPKMVSDLEGLANRAHPTVPPRMLEGLISASTKTLKRDLAKAYAHKDDPEPPDLGGDELPPDVKKAIADLEAALKRSGATDVDVRVMNAADLPPEAPAAAPTAPAADDAKAAA